MGSPLRGGSEFYRKAVLKAVEVFEDRGFTFIDLPISEPLYVQEKALGELSKNSLTFRDFESGELMALRLDFTTQVVRQVSLMKEREFPLMFYYVGKVFKYTSSLEEMPEAGVEVIGDSSIDADIKVIEALHAFLTHLGFQELTVIMGHVGVVESLTRGMEKKEKIKRAFREKNLTSLRELFNGREEIAELVLKQGGEEVLYTLEGKAERSALEDLKKAGKHLREKGINFLYDLSEVREFPYYSGLVFEIFHRDIGSPIAGGGRYDKLSRVVDDNFPATGGAVYLSKLTP